MERFDEFLNTITESKIDLYIKGDPKKDAKYWFEGAATFNNDPKSMENYVGLMVVSIAARMLEDYGKFLEENPK